MAALRWRMLAVVVGVLILAVPLVVLANSPEPDFGTLISHPLPRPLAGRVSPDGAYLYVVQGADLDGGPAPGVLAKLDAHSLDLLETLTLPEGLPHAVALSSDGSQAYVSMSKVAGADNWGSSRLTMIDTETYTITDDYVFADNWVTAVAVHPSESKLYVTSRGTNGKVYVFETGTTTLTYTTAIDVGNRPVGLAVTPDGSRVYTANRGDATLSVIDTVSDSVTQTVNLPIDISSSGTRVAMTPDGAEAYVTFSNYNDAGEWVGQYRFTVVNVDPAHPEFHATEVVTTTGSRLQDVAISDDGAYAFFASKDTGEVLIYDTANRQEMGSVAVKTPEAVMTGPDRNTVYVLDQETNRVVKMKRGRFHVEEQKSMGQGIQLVVVHPSGHSVYALLRAQSTEGGMVPGKVAILDPLTLEPTEVLTLPAGHPAGLDISPDGSQLYASLSQRAGASYYGRDRLVIIDTDPFSITKDLDYGSDDFARLAAHPDGRRVYVTLRASSGQVYIFDAISQTLSGHISVGDRPIGLAITPDGSRVYVANRGDATLSVIETTSDTVTKTLNLPIGESASGTAVTVTPDGSKAYVAYSIYNDGIGWVGQNRLVIVDVDPTSPDYHTTKLVTTTGSRLEYVAVGGDGAYAMVTSGDTDEVIFLDTATDTEIERTYTGDHPFGVTGGLDPAVAYVANQGGTVVRIVREKYRVFLPTVLRQ